MSTYYSIVKNVAVYDTVSLAGLVYARSTLFDCLVNCHMMTNCRGFNLYRNESAGLGLQTLVDSVKCNFVNDFIIQVDTNATSNMFYSKLVGLAFNLK